MNIYEQSQNHSGDNDLIYLLTNFLRFFYILKDNKILNSAKVNVTKTSRGAANKSILNKQVQVRKQDPL